jgi:hypothetical protein
MRHFIGAAISLSTLRFAVFFHRVILGVNFGNCCQTISTPHRTDLQILGGDFGGVGSFGDVLSGLQFHQIRRNAACAEVSSAANAFCVGP